MAVMEAHLHDKLKGNPILTKFLPTALTGCILVRLPEYPCDQRRSMDHLTTRVPIGCGNDGIAFLETLIKSSTKAPSLPPHYRIPVRQTFQRQEKKAFGPTTKQQSELQIEYPAPPHPTPTPTSTYMRVCN